MDAIGHRGLFFPGYKKWQRASSSSAEGKAHGGAQRILIAGWSQKSRSRVARKDDDVRRAALLATSSNSIAWIQGEVAGGLASTVHVLNRFECSLAIVDSENRHAVIPAVGGIDKPTLGIDRYCGCCILSLKAFREG